MRTTICMHEVTCPHHIIFDSMLCYLNKLGIKKASEAGCW